MVESNAHFIFFVFFSYMRMVNFAELTHVAANQAAD